MRNAGHSRRACPCISRLPRHGSPNFHTLRRSRDGGVSFSLPKPPGNLVASVPYPYVINNQQGAYGYSAPSNIVQFEKYFYVLINNWPHGAQKYGPCLLRTKDVFDPSKWRAWD